MEKQLEHDTAKQTVMEVFYIQQGFLMSQAIMAKEEWAWGAYLKTFFF